MNKTMAVSPGEVVGGKYRVDQVLGVGGMGAVVSATHLQLGHKVALKFMLAEALDNRDMVARFLREAQAAANLKSEHVTRVSDMGQLPSGALYIVMEHLEGQDLEKLVRDRGPIAPSEAVELVLQACDAIREAHAAGIVHRDLKPANLFLTKRANGTSLVKVLDFGISKVKPQGDTPSAMTQTSTIIGSPFYMSPEQMVSSRDVDSKTDIWALGVILYELVSGQVPFQAESIGGLVLKVHNERPPPLPPLHLKNAPEFCILVARCMDLDRTRRPTIDELVLELTRIRDAKVNSSGESLARTALAQGASRGSPLARSIEAGPTPPAPTATGAAWGAASGAPVPAKRSRAPIAVAASTLAVVVAAASIYVFVVRARPTTPTPTTVAPAAPAPEAVSPPASSSASSAPSAAPSIASSAPPSPSAPVASATPSSKPAGPRRSTPASTGSRPVVPASTLGSAFDR